MNTVIDATSKNSLTDFLERNRAIFCWLPSQECLHSFEQAVGDEKNSQEYMDTHDLVKTRNNNATIESVSTFCSDLDYASEYSLERLNTPSRFMDLAQVNESLNRNAFGTYDEQMFNSIRINDEKPEVNKILSFGAGKSQNFAYIPIPENYSREFLCIDSDKMTAPAEASTGALSRHEHEPELFIRRSAETVSVCITSLNRFVRSSVEFPCNTLYLLWGKYNASKMSRFGDLLLKKRRKKQQWLLIYKCSDASSRTYRLSLWNARVLQPLYGRSGFLRFKRSEFVVNGFCRLSLARDEVPYVPSLTLREAYDFLFN